MMAEYVNKFATFMGYSDADYCPSFCAFKISMNNFNDVDIMAI